MERPEKLNNQFRLLAAMRNFFQTIKFKEVLTPPLVENPGMETHIHPMKVISTQLGGEFGYLHTSPEFHMKELLSLGFENIYQISYCFRDEPASTEHRNQFLMLEWYRANDRYETIMDDTLSLIEYCSSELEVEVPQIQLATVAEIFQDTLNIDILNFLETKDLVELIEKDFSDIPLPHRECEWDDYYFLLFLNKIEPLLKEMGGVLLYEFPAPLAALSTLKNEKVCERFEIYLKGIEICNAYNELTDLAEQKKRFKAQSKLKKHLYCYKLPEPTLFYSALERGLPPSAGIALGVERLLKALTDIDNPFYT